MPSLKKHIKNYITQSCTVSIRINKFKHKKMKRFVAFDTKQLLV